MADRRAPNPDAGTRAARAHWQNRGQGRPDFAEVPGPGQESVWDYPRPPRLEPERRLLEVVLDDQRIAQSQRALRVLETASPPTVYIPPEDVAMEFLQRRGAGSHCEWKGEATYWDVCVADQRVASVGWSYEDPYPEFLEIRSHFSFYPGQISCWLDGERVRPQPGGFYGGWVTDELVGPFKGEPGTQMW